MLPSRGALGHDAAMRLDIRPAVVAFLACAGLRPALQWSLGDAQRHLIDGKWSHIGRFKGPMLRNLAPRAPYFHNGFAADLDAVVDFYEDRFHLGFSKQDKADLVAFLRSL